MPTAAENSPLPPTSPIPEILPHRLNLINPDVTTLRRMFLRTIAGNVELANQFVKGLLADAWPAYRKLAGDSHIQSRWSIIHQSSDTVRPDFLRLKETLIEWANANHLVNENGPAEWMMDAALSLLKLWRLKPQFEGRIVLAAVPGEIRLPESWSLPNKITFEMKVDWSGESIEIFEARIRREFARELEQRLTQVSSVIAPSTPLKKKRSLTVHFEWLAQNLLLHRSAAEIVAHVRYRVDASSVSDAINDVATMLGLKARRLSGGRPRKLRAPKAAK